MGLCVRMLFEFFYCFWDVGIVYVDWKFSLILNGIEIVLLVCNSVCGLLVFWVFNLVVVY